jgi:hypothetical protein
MSVELARRAAAFWAKVDSSGGLDACWPWTGSVLLSGYGGIGIAGRQIRAHRLAFEIANGPVAEGLVVRHRCDNPICVNPTHLEAGTQRDNLDDMDRRGRRRPARGERQASAKLTDDDVRAIRAAAGSDRAVAKRFGVGHATVSTIRRRVTWRHVA